MNSQTDEMKRKTRFVRSFWIMQVMMYITVFIVIIIVKGITDFSSIIVIEDWILVITNLITGIFCISLMIRSLSLWKQRKSLQNFYLAGFFFFSGIPSLIIAITTIFVPNDLNLQYFLSLAILFLVPGSTVFLATFIAETFYESMDQKLGQLLFFVTQVFSTIANVIGLLLTLRGPTNPYEGVPLVFINIFGGVYIFLNVFLHFLLMRNAFRLRAKVEEKRLRAGLFLLGITGLILGLVFFGRLFDFLFIEAISIPSQYDAIFVYGLDILFFIGYLTMYLGVVVPGKKNQ
ncbi:MAG: hypothetical protein JW776_01050 [Candidatus Lokiarchaeota archaeon]|nr:hypothetical protein [Candidatus Lokiarchaeota archaeon]